MRNFYFMNLNLKMTVERSKRRSYFLSLIFITKCFSKNLKIVMYGITSKLHSTFETIGNAAADEKRPQKLSAKTQGFFFLREELS